MLASAKLRCAVSVKYVPDFENFVKRIVIISNISFKNIDYKLTCFGYTGYIKYVMNMDCTHFF